MSYDRAKAAQTRKRRQAYKKAAEIVSKWREYEATYGPVAATDVELISAIAKVILESNHA